MSVSERREQALVSCLEGIALHADGRAGDEARRTLVEQGIWDAPWDDAPHKPQRDDDIASWLRRQRDLWKGESESEGGSEWHAIDRVLDRYRECADYGITLRPEDDERGDP